MLIAPAVNLSTNAVGRITVVESHNELGATKVKGCLSLADLEELFDGSEGFIRGGRSPRCTRPRAKATKASTGQAAPEALLEPGPRTRAAEPGRSFRRQPPLPSRSQSPLEQNLLPSQAAPEREPAPEPEAVVVAAEVEMEDEDEVTEPPPTIEMPATSRPRPASAGASRATLRPL